MQEERQVPAGQNTKAATPLVARVAASVLLVSCISTASDAAVVLFDNTSADDVSAPAGALNIWYECTGRGAPFQVSQSGFVTAVDVPLINWQGNAQGDLVVELMADVLTPVAPGQVTFPGDVLEIAVHEVADWSAFQRGTMTVELSGSTRLDAGVTYWLGVSLSERIPEGLAGLGWATNAYGQTSKLVSRARVPSDPANFWYESRFVDTNAFRVMGAEVVPLPGAVWLFGSAVGFLALRRRRIS